LEEGPAAPAGWEDEAKMRRLLIMAHRGDQKHAPENTLAAFRKAVAIGADCIELDVRRTRDGHLVVIHDERVDRTTDGIGRVADLSLAELRQLDAGSWFSPEHAGERIPTFPEAIAAIAPHLTFATEIKEPPGLIEAQVLAALKEAGALARTVITSFNADVIRLVKELEPSAKTGLIGSDSGLLERAVAVGASWIDPYKDGCTPELVAAAHAAGIRVTTWIIDAPEELRHYEAMGVDRVTSNDPERLLREAGPLEEGIAAP
jgi:glycerophosphoryl diester phosphodiesterase